MIKKLGPYTNFPVLRGLVQGLGKQSCPHTGLPSSSLQWLVPFCWAIGWNTLRSMGCLMLVITLVIFPPVYLLALVIHWWCQSDQYR